jgi:Phosphate-selective porin O and P
MSKATIAAAVLTALSFVASGFSEDLTQKIQLHGFGDWTFGDTDDNRYLAGEPGREYRHTTLGLAFDANVTDRLRVVGQVLWRDTDETTGSVFDYSFAEWKFSDDIRLRVGQVKLPFGISSEVARVGTLRPFVDLPQGVYGPIGLTGEHYKGIGLTGRHSLGRAGWEVSYDVYGGGMVLEEFQPPEAFVLGEPIDPDHVTEVEETNDLIGGRVILEAPVAGLRFGASSYTGKEIRVDKRRTVYAVHAEYGADPWSVRTELAHETAKGDLKVDGFYAEVAYRITPHWQVAVQYDDLTTEVHDAPTPAVPSLLDHRELAVGLNYWFNRQFVLKLDYHHVKGNRFAAPVADEFVKTIESGRLQDKTDLVQFGAQFSF